MFAIAVLLTLVFWPLYLTNFRGWRSRLMRGEYSTHRYTYDWVR